MQGTNSSCLQVSTGYASLKMGTVIDGVDQGDDGLSVTSNGTAACYNPPADGYPRIRNCDNGTLVKLGSGTSSTGNIQFVNNNIDEDIDASSWES